MRKIFTLLSVLLTGFSLFAQEDTTKGKDLDPVVITGQYKPQSVKNSVYQTRVINSERIRLSGATTVQQVLNNQLGFRFSNDNTTGTTDVQLMGMSGRNVKILLDGVPLIDRGDTRESLGQVDINTIDRIEIVEGPMSVSYGSDALAGVINIITKKSIKENISLTARVQEETAGNEYHPFNYKGVHNQSAGINWQKNGWNAAIGGSHNESDGFGGDSSGRQKIWKPKEQWLGNARVGYSSSLFNIYYRLDGLNEDIVSRGKMGQTYIAKDQQFISDRFMHQLQAEWRVNSRLQINGILSYTDYKRKTKTTEHDFTKGTDELTVGAGEQDTSKLNGFLFRPVMYYKISSAVSLQSGFDINHEKASGARIAGTPSINDYAFFISSEIKAAPGVNIRPGLRFIKNSVYDAPPVIPSINTKFVLSKQLDLRLSYAYGFRSPALRELYFSFHDANHDIDGNPDLKAEHSNNFNGSLSWTSQEHNGAQFSSRLGVFYNVFNNQIDLAQSASSTALYTYFNINKSKTTGGTLENTVAYKDLTATLGFSYIGFFSSLYDDKTYVKEDSHDFLWSPEINSNITYNISGIKTKLGLFYKYTGKRPAFNFETNSSGQTVVYVAKTSSYNFADFTINTGINKYVTLNAGIKNIFDVSTINNSAVNTGSAHSSDGPVPIGYGRSYFLGLSFQWNKK